MKEIHSSSSSAFPKIKFGLSWLIVIPAGLWVLISYYLPVMGGTLDQLETRLVVPIVILLFAFSLFCHIGAHLLVSLRVHADMPSEIGIFIFGDASQSWPSSPGWHEVLAAEAGPLTNLLLAGCGYLLWNAQINDFLGINALLAAGFNAWLFAINQLPVFPMDGGRVIKTVSSSMIAPNQQVNRVLRLSGIIMAAALTVWAVILLMQNARFSEETCAITLLFAVLVLDGLWIEPALETEANPRAGRNTRSKLLGRLGFGVLVLLLSFLPASLLLINNGLDAPGVALPVAPMVNVPPQYHHSHTGSFYLLTVISQAPITSGAWMLAQVDPAIQIVPPEAVTPKNTTPQEQAKQGYQMLDDSEATAIAVGLQLAGYPGTAVGKGAQVMSILPDSHANGMLQVGDIITSLNGKPIQTASELIAAVKAQSQAATVQLQARRGNAELHVTVPLMKPSSVTETPKIGISIQDAGFDFKPPFPISIETQKINGGPSAGLMFTLTVANTLRSDDLTHGRRIAGTGTINLDGTVGPIGGVKQKVFAAEAVGASYFLCPAENYADALSVARDIKVIKVTSIQDALNFLHSLPVS